MVNIKIFNPLSSRHDIKINHSTSESSRGGWRVGICHSSLMEKEHLRLLAPGLAQLTSPLRFQQAHLQPPPRSQHFPFSSPLIMYCSSAEQLAHSTTSIFSCWQYTSHPYKMYRAPDYTTCLQLQYSRISSGIGDLCNNFVCLEGGGWGGWCHLTLISFPHLFPWQQRCEFNNPAFGQAPLAGWCVLASCSRWCTRGACFPPPPHTHVANGRLILPQTHRCTANARFIPQKPFLMWTSATGQLMIINDFFSPLCMLSLISNIFFYAALQRD